MQQQTVLVVEDEKDIADIVIYNLEKEGFAVHWERDGRDGLLRAQDIVPDLVILDEPFRGLDREQRYRLTARVRRLWPQATLLCITHDIEVTQSFDQVLVLQ